jgi:ABC-type Mn2+/Zn2+ transport system ATPase subunit
MGRARHVGWLRWPGREDRKRAAAALEQVGMVHLRNRQIGQLSGGQRRRVFIARALAQETDVLMLDEPFNGIDVTATNEIMDTLDRLRDAHITVIVSTHDLGMVASTFDRLLVINREVIAFGPPADVMRPDVLQRAYSGHISIIQDTDSTLFITSDDHAGVGERL